MDTIKGSFIFKILKIAAICFLGIISAAAQTSEHQKNLRWLQQQNQIAASTVLLNNKSGFIPIKDLEKRIVSVNLGSANSVIFDSLLNKYTSVTSVSAGVTDSALFQLSLDLKYYNSVIVQMLSATFYDQSVRTFLSDIQKSKQLVVVVYGPPGFLIHANDIHHPIISVVNDTPVAANFVAQLIFGGVPSTGKLLNTWSGKYRKKDGFFITSTRLKYTLPEDVGLSISDLEPRIDSIVENGIQGKAAPGAVVMVLKDGKVIYNKAYGKHTYEGDEVMGISDIFDMASITKVSASTMSVMRLYEQNKIVLDSTFGYYIPSARNTNKSKLTIRDLLLHQSGIAAGVGLPIQPTDISSDSSAEFPIKAGDHVFVKKDYFNRIIWPAMLHVKLDTPKYVYSDLSMTYMKEVIENQSASRLDEYVSKQFYHPLGMQSAGFNPLNRFDSSKIVPTEKDADFRKGLLRGYVHDPMAAKYGGVSGNAGLFASANDLAILYQMILNKGMYGGKRYFSAQTVQLFTSRQSSISRRGLGFDRIDTTSATGYPSRLASKQTYGHTGFTGTSFWVDPAYNLVYIFLSNRVYPTATSNLYKLRVQANILDVFYEAIMKTSAGSIYKKDKTTKL